MGNAIRRGFFVSIALAALAGIAPAVASAATTTFYVASTGSDAGNSCTVAATPCLTIQHAVGASETTPGLGLIDVAPGTYITTISLTNLSDFGLTIAGTGATPGATVIEGPVAAGQSTITFGAGFAVGSLALSNLTVFNPSGNQRTAISGAGALSLSGVVVLLAETTSGAVAISDSLGPITLAGTSVTVDGTGDGVDGSSAALTMTGSTVTQAGTTGSGDAVSVDQGSAAIGGSTLTTTAGGDGVVSSFGPVSVGTTTIAVNGTGSAVFADGAATTLVGDAISMNDVASGSSAVAVAGSNVNISGTTVGGIWHGSGINLQNGGGTIAGSTIVTNTLGNNAPAVAVSGGSPTNVLLVTHSSLAGRSGASPGTLAVTDSDLVTDSTLVQGGQSGISFNESGGKANTATIDSTTIDAGVAGIGAQGGVSAVATNAGAGRSTTVLVNGSILVQAPVATVSGGGTATVACTDTDVPNTAQPGSSSLGAISCATGATGNTSSAITSLFVAPGTNDQLLPTSTAVDSVPEAAVALPDGFTSSTTDVAGAPRIADGNGDCSAARDRGAFELQGQAGLIPAPAITAPATLVTGVVATFSATVPNDPAATLVWQFSDGATASGPTVTHAFVAAGTATATVTATGSPATCAAPAAATIAVVALPAATPLALAPARFHAARSGGSLATHHAKGVGTVVTYDDSQAATMTFTIQGKRKGRRVGSRCVKPSHNNRHEPRCTSTVTLGHFTHVDVAGTNTFVFTGRVGGKPLPAGSYQLKGVPSNTNGAGAAVVKSFTIS